MKHSSIVAIFSAAALVLAACGSSSDAADDGAAGSGSSATTDTGGSDSDTGDTDTSGHAEGSDNADLSFVDGGTFTLALPSDPGNLDPQMTTLGTTYQLDRFLYDSLVMVGKDGSLVPYLAESWDGGSTSATFTLREGITCNDDSELTATTVADNINFVGDPDNASSRIGIWAQPGTTAKADDAARTVTITSPSPDPFLIRNIGQMQIVCDAGMADRDLLAQDSVGTGPYTMTEAVPNDHYTLTRRTDYTWGPGDYDPKTPGQPDTVVLKVVENATTAANLLLAGDANAGVISGSERQRMVDADLFHRDTPISLGELWFNHDAGHATADKATRIALVKALDLDKLAAVVGGDAGGAPTGLVPSGPCTADSWAGHVPNYDPSAASSVLSGQSLNLTLRYVTSLGPGVQAGAELIQALWAEVGVTVDLKPMTDTQSSAILFGGQGSWDVTILPLNVSVPTMLVPFLSGATPPDGTNFSFIDNPDYAAHTAAAQEQTGDASCGDWKAAESALFEAADMLPFVDSVQSVFGTGARFDTIQGHVLPTSIRMLG